MLVEKFENQAYEKEEGDKKSIIIKSAQWKNILDKNQKSEDKPAAEGGGGFFLNFDDAPKADNTEIKVRVSIPTKMDAEDLEKKIKKE